VEEEVDNAEEWREEKEDGRGRKTRTMVEAAVSFAGYTTYS
jgi:hypothetical protein